MTWKKAVVACFKELGLRVPGGTEIMIKVLVENRTRGLPNTEPIVTTVS
jgi:hypothetical protein